MRDDRPVIRFTLPDTLARELCERLATPLPSTWAEVGALYRRWCAEIPFDTIAKCDALRRGEVPPGADAVEVVERWMATGVGSACWGHCTAFAGVLGAVGIDSHVAIDRAVRTDGVIDFHSFVIVEDSMRDWVFDHVHATDGPVRFLAGGEGRHGPYAAGFRMDGDRLIHWFRHPERPDVDGRYVILSTDLEVDDVRAFCAISRDFSGIPGRRLHARRFPEGELVNGHAVADGSALELSLIHI